MKYFVLLVLVALVHCQEDYVPKTREEITAAYHRCLSKLEMSEETFKEKIRGLNGDEALYRSMVKCATRDLGFLEESQDGTGVFNKERLVKQFGGEASRDTVTKCIEEHPIGTPTFDDSVYEVMHCLEISGLKIRNE